MFQECLRFELSGRGPISITSEIQQVITRSELKTGLAHLFLQHTSASLIINENADPSVLTDLETVLKRLVVDGDPAYQHNNEGPDDMAAHARTMLTNNDLTVPFGNGRLALGTWQDIYLYEHRARPQTRQLVVTVQGT